MKRRMTGLSKEACGLVLLSIMGCAQVPKAADPPFELTWTKGRCVGCKIAAGLGRVQFVSRNDALAWQNERKRRMLPFA